MNVSSYRQGSDISPTLRRGLLGRQASREPCPALSPRRDQRSIEQSDTLHGLAFTYSPTLYNQQTNLERTGSTSGWQYMWKYSRSQRLLHLTECTRLFEPTCFHPPAYASLCRRTKLDFPQEKVNSSVVNGNYPISCNLPAAGWIYSYKIKEP